MSKSRRSLNPANTEGSDADAASNDESNPNSPINGAGPSSKRGRKGDIQAEVDAQVAKEMA
jgi:hypothetical protein